MTDDTGMARVTLNYWAGARAAAGTDRDQLEAESVAAALDQVRSIRPGQRLADVLTVSSFMVDGQVWSAEERARSLSFDVQVEVLPPFAGG